LFHRRRIDNTVRAWIVNLARLGLINWIGPRLVNMTWLRLIDSISPGVAVIGGGAHDETSGLHWCG